MHIFGKGAGTRGSDGGERDQQSLIGCPDRGERAKIDAQGVFTCHVCRTLDARRALQCDLATVLLKSKYNFFTWSVLIFKLHVISQKLHDFSESVQLKKNYLIILKVF